MIYGMAAVCMARTYLKFERSNQQSFVIELVGLAHQEVPGYPGFT